MTDGPHIKRQHVVSRVVLARFAVDKIVEVEDVRKPGRWRPKSPSAVAYVKNYVRHDSAGAEAVWQQTETHLGAALDELDGVGFPNWAPGPSRRLRTAWRFTGLGAIRLRPPPTQHGNGFAGRAPKTSRGGPSSSPESSRSEQAGTTRRRKISPT